MPFPQVLSLVTRENKPRSFSHSLCFFISRPFTVFHLSPNLDIYAKIRHPSLYQQYCLVSFNYNGSAGTKVRFTQLHPPISVFKGVPHKVHTCGHELQSSSLLGRNDRLPINSAIWKRYSKCTLLLEKYRWGVFMICWWWNTICPTVTEAHFKHDLTKTDVLN